MEFSPTEYGTLLFALNHGMRSSKKYIELAPDMSKQAAEDELCNLVERKNLAQKIASYLTNQYPLLDKKKFEEIASCDGQVDGLIAWLSARASG